MKTAKRTGLLSAAPLAATLILLTTAIPAMADSEAGFIFLGGGDSESGGVYGSGAESESGGAGASGAESESGGARDSGAESESGGALNSGGSTESGGATASGASSEAIEGGNDANFGKGGNWGQYVHYYGN
jgi:hypothetical protein